MFENFSERGRRAIELARAQAREFQHHYIGTEHLLIGILVEGRGTATKALGACGITAEGARLEVIEIVGPGHDPVAGQIPFTPRARNILLRANRVRLSLGADAVEPEHLLLALVRDDGGIAIQVLSSFGVDAEAIRTDVVRAASAPPHDD